MPSRKRPIAAVDDGPDEPEHLRLLHRIRSMWQFANVAQWINMFGKVAKIDEAIDVEELEAACLKPNSTVLADIALALLKLTSSHRGLTHDIFDDQARKVFLARKADDNPFGHEEARTFDSFDIFTKIRVLQQLTQWAMIHPERIRDKMEEQRDIDQTSWRIEPYGWDSDDRTYYVLDDNRIYRLTEAPPPPPKVKASKRKRLHASRRSSARRRATISSDEPQHSDVSEAEPEPERKDDGLGGMTWECLAVTLHDVRDLLDGWKKTRDQNEKILRRRIDDHLVPILEQQEESRKRKELQRERELLSLAKMANAKRSSRIADKAEHQRQDDVAREESRSAAEAEATRRREEQKQLKMEKERDFRLVSRGQRLQEREARRKQHQEELAALSLDTESGGSEARISERRIHVEIERKKQALKDIEDEEDDWVFDCICGTYGHIDDGAHSIACERCNVWQHSQCLNISEEEAERPEFVFICSSCVRREEEAKTRPKTTIKLKVNGSSSSDRPLDQAGGNQAADANKNGYSLVVELPANRESQIRPSSYRDFSQSITSFEESRAQHQDSVSHSAAGDNVRGQVIPNGVGHGHLQNGSALVDEEKLASHDTPGRKAEHNDKTPAKTPGHLHNLALSPATAAVELKQPAWYDQAASSPLKTPTIGRESYAGILPQNDVLPTQGGLSPTKHSPRSFDPSQTVKVGTTPVIPPVAPLHPSPHRIIMTPPVKSTQPSMSHDNQNGP